MKNTAVIHNTSDRTMMVTRLPSASVLAATLLCELLRIEWIVDPPGQTKHCPRCLARLAHRADCSLDAALVLAGFPDNARRSEARKALEAT